MDIRHKFKLKAQVTLYFLSVMAAMIALAFVVIMVGKTAKDKTFADNAADAGALATCSVMAQAFNQNSYDNARQEAEEVRSEELEKEREKMSKKNEGDNWRKALRGIFPANNPFDGEFHANGAGENARAERRNPSVSSDHVTKGHADGQQNHAQEREQMKEYTDQALAEGYKMCFNNSGTAHRLGRATSKLYEKFIESIQPGSVFSGQPKTFAWLDGAGRFHMVTCIIELEPTNVWLLRTSQMDYPTQQATLKEAETAYASSEAGYEQSKATFIAAQPTFPCPPGLCLHLLAKVIARTIGFVFFAKGFEAYERFREGYFNDKTKLSKTFGDAANEYIKYRDDIVHSRTVTAFNFQFHMGSPIKSMWGDIDQTVFYPPVFAVAIASFNYIGRGNIHRRGSSGSDPRHECGLIAAF
ncbi:MAG: Tad domain-containing protein [Candidatus Omnitrophica bacterium]|nr:Tad domain-containing protein [Candidatus Omnitrophota bacterium]